ncbi:uncharacterized protein LOC128860035 [Anastrepha ludens]|uniref:uncharacterized protein LOC128860035 n=1 Tax=Anastrepha ludens TaxID=28586 RepID=UPI0023AEDD67|nr:uncharacterized protein LOC128860035 [Anastrepha ludens]
MPDDLDVRRLIEEVKARPILWDLRYGKDRTNTPPKWAEIAAILGVDVEHCKRKWKNLRDAYRAELRRTERRVERLKASGDYDSSMNIGSKWAYFEPMSFINDTRRPRYHSHTHRSEGEGSNGSIDEPPGFHSFCDIKMEPHHTSDEDEREEEERLLEQFVSAATPQAVRRLSNSISVANAVEDATTSATSRRASCKCSNRADDQVHFLENLEREEQSLMQSTRMDMRRDNNTSHVGDSDYNFLVSFLPQMKRMSELQNLQFRAKMSELLLNIMTPNTGGSVQPMTTAQQQQPQQLQLQQTQQQSQPGVIQCVALPQQSALLQMQIDSQQLQQGEQRSPVQQMEQQPQQTPAMQQQFTTTVLMDAEPLENSSVSISNEMSGDNSTNWA